MRFELITIFPDFFAGPLEHGILRRARETGIVDVKVQDLRVFTKDRHRSVDDRPFGGGEGMVLKPQPLFEAVEHLLGTSVGDSVEKKALPEGMAIVLLSASGKKFDQGVARRFAKLSRVILICGRYEGVDERVAEHLATDEISIGDFVLSGGELPAILIVDAVTRLLPGSLGNEASSQNESFRDFEDGDAEEMDRVADSNADGGASQETAGLSHPKNPTLRNPGWGTRVVLDFPHYTRPAEYRGWRVPDVLIGGNHAEVAAWRAAAAAEKMRRNRPDLKNL